jgi:hypothetical protein
MTKPCSFEQITGRHCHNINCDIGDEYGINTQNMCCAGMIRKHFTPLQILVMVAQALFGEDPADYALLDEYADIDPVILRLVTDLVRDGVLIRENDASYAEYSEMFQFLFWRLQDRIPNR